MSANNHHQDGSFWPAYVDAITNVMLNILFVVAVFAMALNTVVKDAPKEKPVEVASSAQTSQDTVKANEKDRQKQNAAQQKPQLPEAQPKSMFVKESAIQGINKPAGLRWAVTREERNGERLVRFDFEPGNSQITATDASAVRETLRKVSSARQDLQWHIWVTLNTRNTADTRQAYLRAMAVRNALIDAGQAPQNIDMRLLDDGQDPQNTGKQTVWLSRSLQASAPAPS